MIDPHILIAAIVIAAIAAALIWVNRPFPYPHAPRPPQPGAKNIPLSVLVCTHNRSHNIVPCLDLIVQALSNAAPIDAEIIVTNNASRDDTAAVVTAWAAKCPFPVHLRFEGRKGASYARNCCLRAAQGRLLIWTDDDCRLAPDFITTALKLDSADGDALVLRGGRVALGDPSDYPISITYRDTPQQWHLTKYRSQLGGSLMGANMMMRRALVDKLGTFDERFGPGSNIPAGEETDYIYRAFAAGILVEFVPELIVYHHHGRKTVAEARNVQRNYLIAAGAVLAKHAIRFPLKYAAILAHTKNALLETLSGGKNRYMPHVDISYRHLVAYFFIGNARFLSASTVRRPQPFEG